MFRRRGVRRVLMKGEGDRDSRFYWNALEPGSTTSVNEGSVDGGVL